MLSVFFIDFIVILQFLFNGSLFLRYDRLKGINPVPIPSLICPLTLIYPIVLPLKHLYGSVGTAGRQCSTLSKDLGQHLNRNSECAVSYACI